MEEHLYRFNSDRLYYMEKYVDDPKSITSESASVIFNEEMQKLFADPMRTLVFAKSQMSVIGGLKLAANEYERRFASHWFFVSFFHNDKDTAKLPVTHPRYADPIEEKAQWILDMTEFPFVKKVEIPLDKVITLKYLKKLFRDFA
ncbi:MAG: hypothetical protein LBS82_00880 [Spirochaetaceae bacterium]|nr:hypothetical protein [Spirochaetaceae bacterium]